jgi:hypothetical protein
MQPCTAHIDQSTLSAADHEFQQLQQQLSSGKVSDAKMGFNQIQPQNI